MNTTEQLSVEKIMSRLYNLARYCETTEQAQHVHEIIFDRPINDRRLALIEQRLGIAIVPVEMVTARQA